MPPKKIVVKNNIKEDTNESSIETTSNTSINSIDDIEYYYINYISILNTNINY